WEIWARRTRTDTTRLDAIFADMRTSLTKRVTQSSPLAPRGTAAELTRPVVRGQLANGATNSAAGPDGIRGLLCRSSINLQPLMRGCQSERQPSCTRVTRLLTFLFVWHGRRRLHC